MQPPLHMRLTWKWLGAGALVVPAALIAQMIHISEDAPLADFSFENTVPEEMVVVAPEVFMRDTGKPRRHDVTFTVPHALSNDFVMRVQNGTASGTRRVSSAVITLNGTELFGPAAFNQNVVLATTSVALAATNTLSVELQGAPHSGLVVTIEVDPTEVLNTFALFLTDTYGGIPSGAESHQPLVLEIIPEELLEELRNLVAHNSYLLLRVIPAPAPGPFQLIPVGISQANTEAHEGAFALLDVIEAHGMQVDPLREVLEKIEIHQEGREAGGIQLDGFGLFIPPPISLVHENILGFTVSLDIQNPKGHILLSTTTTDILETKTFFTNGQLKLATTNFFHEMLHVLSWHTGCFTGADEDNAVAMAAMESIPARLLNDLSIVEQVRVARENGWGACLDLLALGSAPVGGGSSGFWATYQKDMQHSGRATSTAGPPFATSSDVSVKWHRQFPTLVKFGPLVAADGTIYAAWTNELHALDPGDGSPIWQTPATTSGPISSGALGSDGTIYTCSIKRFSGEEGTLSAFAPADGAFRWNFVVGGPRSCNSPVVDKKGSIFTTTPPPLNSQSAVVVAVNSDGTERWRFEESANTVTIPALSHNGDRLYAALPDRLMAMSTSQTGTPHILWEQPPPLFSYELTRVAVVDDGGSIYAAQNLPRRGFGRISKFTPAGSLALLSDNLGDMQSLALGMKGALVVPVLRTSTLLLVDPLSGAREAFIFLPDTIAQSSLAIDKNNMAYVGTHEGIAAVDLTARKIGWFFETPEPVSAAPALGPDGTLYVVAGDTLYALGE